MFFYFHPHGYIYLKYVNFVYVEESYCAFILFYSIMDFIFMWL